MWSSMNIDDAVRPGQHVLVLGYGVGLDLSAPLARGASRVVCIDGSLLKLLLAFRSHRLACLTGRLELRWSDLHALSDLDALFDHVLVTIPQRFTDQLPSILQGIFCSTAPGGSVVIATRRLNSVHRAMALGEEIRLTLIGGGWVSTKVERQPGWTAWSVLVQARKPSKACADGPKPRQRSNP